MSTSTTTQRSVLHTNEFILAGDHLSSMDGQFHAKLTREGELQVIWGAVDTGAVIWSVYGGQPTGEYALQVKDGGNLCIYPAANGQPYGNPLWWSAPPTCQADCYVNMQTDGNLALYRGEGPEHKSFFVWATGCVVRLASDNCGVWSAASTMGSKITLMLSSQAPVGSDAPAHAVSVRTINTSDPAQRWTRWERRQYDNVVGYVFKNHQTGRYLGGAGNKGSLVATTAQQSDLIWWRKGESGGAKDYALVPVGNDGLVLNVFGDGPYVNGNQVGLWTWSGSWIANINSCWQIQG